MFRRVLACFVTSLAAAPAALAAGPNPGVAQGGPGVVAPGGAIRYVALGVQRGTTVAAIRTKDGRVVRYATYPGSFGVPAVAFDGSTGGVSSDGSTLVLADTSFGTERYPLKRRSSFAIVNAKNLRLRDRVTLRGDFAFDALSPDASTLYLIQHVSGEKLTRYVVRAYDLRRGRLAAGRIADKTQRGWVMDGMPLARTSSTGGRWVYTFYGHPGGYPFVHALDTVRGTAHCIGIPWKGSQDDIWKLRLSLRDGGNTLALRWRSGRPYLAVAVGTWRISYPARQSGGFPWWIVGLGAGGGAVLVAGGLLARGSRRRVGRVVPSPSA